MSLIFEIFNKKSLIWNFAISELKIKYRNSILGFFWTLLEPLMFLTVIYLVMSNIMKINIEHFEIYLLLGLILWNLFQKGTTTGLESLISKKALVTQIYFPREIISISTVLAGLIMISFEFVVLGIFMVAFQFIPPITILVLPLIVLLQAIFVLGLCLPLSVLNIKYRDIKFIWLVVIQAGFFLTPIFYELTILPEYLQNILVYSPMVQIVTMAHDVTIYGNLPSFDSIIIAIGTTMLVFILGFLVFKKLERSSIEEL